ncbi:hypothetical protein GCM10009828_050390 [Actinoplanes couchii]|uniref:Uncharacterized protein n=1 Tax=Actinoplanes couchii TaxID=403638 RepID=A0ABQ3X806_9ACTN|nr:hypothetical protein Aco03nite_030210 [Actinoplanes couchii]
MRTEFLADSTELTPSLHLVPEAGQFPPVPAPGTWERMLLKSGAGREFVVVNTSGKLVKPVLRVGDKSYPPGGVSESAVLIAAVAPKVPMVLEPRVRPGGQGDELQRDRDRRLVDEDETRLARYPAVTSVRRSSLSFTVR